MIAVLEKHGQLVLTADERVEDGFQLVEVRNLGPGDVIIERIDLVVSWPVANEPGPREVTTPSPLVPHVIERGGKDPVLNFAILEASRPSRKGWSVPVERARVDVIVTCLTPAERATLAHVFGLEIRRESIVLTSLGGRSQVHL